MDFANHKEDCLLGTRVSVENMADMLDALAETEYGRLQHFKVIRPEHHDLATRVKIERRPAVSIHPKKRNMRRLRVTARGAHTDTGHYYNVPAE